MLRNCGRTGFIFYTARFLWSVFSAVIFLIDEGFKHPAAENNRCIKRLITGSILQLDAGVNNWLYW
ncbi:hypothetical protein BC343_17370 [Mucilaginibacter pedocola]|uniref:Uncharacterized protein n=1 Tax=Mucilaginibacter pedocola TaxID=1792845 RepID=A0A1S9P742_9SPHI|nr:hypothetical protein BC343_17370 [Mucilaginibacter pedocola]